MTRSRTFHPSGTESGRCRGIRRHLCVAAARRAGRGDAARVDEGCTARSHRVDRRNISNENHGHLLSGTRMNDPVIGQISAHELKALIESGAPFQLVDVRTEEERGLASIEGSRLLDQAYYETLLGMDRD